MKSLGPLTRLVRMSMASLTGKSVQISPGNAGSGDDVNFELPNEVGPSTHEITTNDSDQILTTKSIDSDNNTITNIVDADIKAAAAIDATKIANGTVTSAEFQYLGGVTSDVQTQIDSKEGTLTNSAGLAAALSDETGTGVVVFGTSPSITTPTGIVKGDVGLGNVDNTSDVNKPISTATQTALDLKEDDLPISTRGDILVRDASNITARLPVGAVDTVLSSDGTDVSWNVPESVGLGEGAGVGAMQSQNITGAIDGSASGQESVAIGSGSSSGYRSASIGHSAVGIASYSVAIGAFTFCQGNESVAIGSNAEARLQGVSIGQGAKSFAENNVLIGHDALTAAPSANELVAIGKSSLASFRGVAIGHTADANTDGVSIGNDAVAGTQGISIGAGSSGDNFSISIGYGADSAGSNSVAIGHDSSTSILGAVAIGRSAEAVDNSTAIGSLADGTSNSVAVGESSGVTSGVNSVSIGRLSKATADSVAVGMNSGNLSSGGQSVYLGFESGKSAAGDQNVYLGHQAGSLDTASDRLIIQSDGNIITPLIDGTFDTQGGTRPAYLKVNGRFQTSWTDASAAFSTLAGDKVRADTTTVGAFTLTLPTPSDGDEITITDSTSNFATANVTVATPGAETILGDSTLVMDVDNAAITLVYNLSTTNWIIGK